MSFFFPKFKILFFGEKEGERGMGVSARVKCAAAVVFLAAAARVRKWRRDDLIVNGYFRAVGAVLTRWSPAPCRCPTADGALDHRVAVLPACACPWAQDALPAPAPGLGGAPLSDPRAAGRQGHPADGLRAPRPVEPFPAGQLSVRARGAHVGVRTPETRTRAATSARPRSSSR